MFHRDKRNLKAALKSGHIFIEVVKQAKNTEADELTKFTNLMR